MRRLTFCLISLVLAPAPTLAQPLVTVTLYDVAGLPVEVREALKNETSRIFRQAGLEIGWLECEVAGRPLNLTACALPLGPTRLMLQLAPGKNSRSPRASGFASIRHESSVFACLYPERVSELARDANWEFGDLLGHAAAHELGHLLLHSASHTPAGVMRARWETEDLRKLSHAGLIFLPGQIKHAHAATSQRPRDETGQLP